MMHRPEGVKEYAQLMEQAGIKTHLKIANNGKCVGLKYQLGESMVKGSTVGKLFSGANIEKAIIKGITRAIAPQINIVRNISKGLSR
jgi:hypothetical protein